MLLYSNENLVHMTCEQEKCYNLINGNDKILIIKKRQSGASSQLNWRGRCEIFSFA